MAKWKFNFVMECLSLILQIAVLLLGYALSQYLWTINYTVAYVIIGFTVAGLLFYALIVTFAIMSYNCPFQTPASHVLRHFIFYKGKLARLRSIPSLVSTALSKIRKKLRIPLPRQKEVKSHNDVESNYGSRDLPPVEAEKEVQPMFHTPPLTPDRIADINCASWLLSESSL